VRFAVTVVSPPGYLHAAAFHEVAETIYHGLRCLGHYPVLTSTIVPARRHIVLGSNLLADHPLPLPADSILYNLEQVDPGWATLRPQLLELLRRYEVWDYSARNAAALGTLGVRVSRIVPIGYAKELTRIVRAQGQEPDIDVLFFGSVNPRRQAVLERMRALGLRVRELFGVYGKARDDFIARSKLVVNIHYYGAKVLEMVRLSYLLANRCVVLSECSSNPEEDATLAAGVAFADYEALAERARALAADAPERARLAERGFSIMSARPIADYLRAALEEQRHAIVI
jgi:hypothetical protein